MDRSEIDKMAESLVEFHLREWSHEAETVAPIYDLESFTDQMFRDWDGEMPSDEEINQIHRRYVEIFDARS